MFLHHIQNNNNKKKTFLLTSQIHFYSWFSYVPYNSFKNVQILVLLNFENEL